MTYRTSTKNDEELIARYLEPDPADPDPAAWRLKERSVPVWAIIGSLTEEIDNIDQVSADYGVSPDAMEATLAYYRQHRCLIEARLAANAA